MAKLADIKTKVNAASVQDFIQTLPEAQQADTQTLITMMEKATGLPPKMWGSNIIGFGILRYKSPTSGREVEWFHLGFSPRKANFSLNLIDLSAHEELLFKLGKHKTGKGCLYINKLSDVDTKVLEKIIKNAAKAKPPGSM